MPETSAFRIIDVNLNRAREALRVMEEFARLRLDDVGLTRAIKETRHGLGQAVIDFEERSVPTGIAESARGEARGSVVRTRDIVGDVGCEVAVPTEYHRADSVDVVSAACKRATEALRVIEEYGKIIDPTFAGVVERIRYRSYELERRLLITADAIKRLGQVRLYVIITESSCRGDWFATAEGALKGGADCLQLREKNLSDRELLRRANRLAELCRQHDALFVVNDRPDIAALARADGVHLGQDDMSVASARRIVPPRCLVGLSTHTVEQVRAAAEDAPDYVAVGPMFQTSTKPRDCLAGVATLTAARRETSIPLVAIGGIDEHNAAGVLAATRCTLCVCRAVTAQGDVEAATMRLRSLVERAFSSGPSSPT